MIFSLFKKSYFESIMILTETSIFRQHKNSFLGSSWSVLQPFIHIMIISYVFSFLFKQPAEVLVRNLIAGIPLWTFIMNSLLSGSKSLIDRSEILKKISIRKTLLPISDILVHFYTFLWAFISMYLALIIIYPAYLSFTIIYAPIVIIPTIISIICVGAALAYITPYIMDVPHIITVLLNAVYWTLPILYPYDLIPEEKKWLFEINPLFHLIRPLQYLVLNCTFPPLIIMIKACLIMLISMIISYYVINALSRNVVYYL